MSNTLNNKKIQNANELIISGHVWKAVWSMAWPTAINNIFMTLYQVINRIFVGRLPNAEESLAAVGLGGSALMLQFAITVGVSAAASALVSRFLGAQENDNACKAAGQSITLSLIGGIVSGLILVASARSIMIFIGAHDKVLDISTNYMIAISLYGSIPLFLYIAVTTILRCTGDAVSPLYAGIVSMLTNILLDYILIFGHGPFPRMEVQGAALATNLSRTLGVIVSLYFLRKSIVAATLNHLKPRWEWIKRILVIGWPAAIQNLLLSGAGIGFITVLSLLPRDQLTAAQAALTVAMGIESIAFMPGFAYGMAAAPLVGQNLGAGKPDRAAHCGWVACAQAALGMGIIGIMFFIIPKPLALIFTSETSVVSLVVSYLRINAISEPFLAANMTIRGALQGAGETKAPAWLTFITLWVIRMPLAWILIKLGYGAPGAWLAMCITTIISGILISAIFLKGRWKDLAV